MKRYSKFPLSKILYYRIGGIADTVIEITKKDDLLSAIDFIQTNHIENVLPVGLGSNMLLSDEPFRGVVLWFNEPDTSSFSHGEHGIVSGFASEILDDMIQYTFSQNLVGLEWAGGLPSTLGAAARGNVGCFGKEIQDIFYQVEAIVLENDTFQTKTFTKEAMQFGYRDSFFKHHNGHFISEVFLKLTQGTEKDRENAKRTYQNNISYRKTHHPTRYPSCGSVFKNITDASQVAKICAVWPDIQELSRQKWYNKIAMGYVINRLGFSAYTVGGAQVSEQHANYIVNKHNASFTDVYTIIQTIQEKFLDTFGFTPETEVEIIR